MTWARIWALGCIALIVVVAYSGEQCRKAIAGGDTCAGFGETAQANGGTYFAMLVVAAVVGGLLLRHLQRQAETRPCPRCGARLSPGETSCPCGYDYDTA